MRIRQIYVLLEKRHLPILVIQHYKFQECFIQKVVTYLPTLRSADTFLFLDEKIQSLRTFIPHLPDEIETQQRNILQKEDELAAERLRLAPAACSVLEAHGQLIEVIIQILEQTSHGSIARGVKARLDHLALVADSIDAKLK